MELQKQMLELINNYFNLQKIKIKNQYYKQSYKEALEKTRKKLCAKY